MKQPGTLHVSLGCALLLHLLLAAHLPAHDLSLSTPQRISVRLQQFAAAPPAPQPPMPAAPLAQPALEKDAHPQPRPRTRTPSPPGPAPKPLAQPQQEGSPQPPPPAEPHAPAARQEPVSHAHPAPPGAEPTTSAADAPQPQAAIPAPEIADWRPSYLNTLSAWLERYKNYPLPARRQGLEGDIVVQLRLDRNGRVIARDIVQSSGHRLLDEAVLRMVEQAQPFPPPPHEHGGAQGFEVRLPVSFNLRG